jgi:hypothetical protein
VTFFAVTEHVSAFFYDDPIVRVAKNCRSINTLHISNREANVETIRLRAPMSEKEIRFTLRSAIKELDGFPSENTTNRSKQNILIPTLVASGIMITATIAGCMYGAPYVPPSPTTTTGGSGGQGGSSH